jgi:acid stress-induced BolA-like protein IbaG/YrbA
MITAQQLQGWIKDGLACDFIQVRGDDGQHFEALVVSAAFRGKMLVARQQMVYKTLGDKMRSEIHALSMKTLTPEEWQSDAMQGRNPNG